jgi:hypothetical protein
VVVRSDLFFKTAETNAEETILSMSLETKAFLEILNEKIRLILM